MRLELHQGLGGVRFVTHGSGQVSLMGSIERPGERIAGRVSISGLFVAVKSYLFISTVVIKCPSLFDKRF